MALAFQLFLRGLDGRTSCLRFPSTVVTGSLIQEQISATLQLPADALVIYTGTGLVHRHTSLSADSDGFFPSCFLATRLRGGKGGFGSLLRGAATKAGQKKTSNFDACRDMSGRRLRHVNAEKKLKEWKAQAKDRELEKTANEFLKKQVKRKEDDSGCSQVIEKFRAETSRAREAVESAVASGLAEARKLGKRKVVDDDLLPASSSKRAHSLYKSDIDAMGDDDENVTDRSDDDNDDDGRNCFEIEDFKEGLASPEVEDVSEDEEDPLNKKHEACKMEEDHMSFDNGKPAEFSNSALSEYQYAISCSDKNPDILPEEGKTDSLAEGKPQEDHGNDCLTVNAKESVHTVEVEDNDSSFLSGSTGYCDAEQYNAKAINEQKASDLLPAMKNHPMGDQESAEQTQETLKLERFLHASDLEVLGLDRLKLELQARGLKCGGTLSERAGRLFLLKNIPLEKLDRKYFAKARG